MLINKRVHYKYSFPAYDFWTAWAHWITNYLFHSIPIRISVNGWKIHFFFNASYLEPFIYKNGPHSRLVCGYGFGQAGDARSGSHFGRHVFKIQSYDTSGHSEMELLKTIFYSPRPSNLRRAIQIIIPMARRQLVRPTLHHPHVVTWGVRLQSWGLGNINY